MQFFYRVISGNTTSYRNCTLLPPAQVNCAELEEPDEHEGGDELWSDDDF